jgi:hypothetical protein
VVHAFLEEQLRLPRQPLGEEQEFERPAPLFLSSTVELGMIGVGTFRFASSKERFRIIYVCVKKTVVGPSRLVYSSTRLLVDYKGRRKTGKELVSRPRRKNEKK